MSAFANQKPNILTRCCEDDTATACILPPRSVNLHHGSRCVLDGQEAAFVFSKSQVIFEFRKVRYTRERVDSEGVHELFCGDIWYDGPSCDSGLINADNKIKARQPVGETGEELTDVCEEDIQSTFFPQSLFADTRDNSFICSVALHCCNLVI